VLAVVALVAGVVVATRGRTQAITISLVSKDGQFVEVSKTDQRFGYPAEGRSPHLANQHYRYLGCEF
jgi:hypothetical protein